MSEDQYKNISYSLDLKCRFILVFGVIGSISVSFLFIYLLFTDPFAIGFFFYAVCFVMPLLYATTYFAYQKKILSASYLATLASIFGCFAALNLLFSVFITSMMIFVLAAMFIAISKKQIIFFYAFILLTIGIKLIAELKLFVVSFMPTSDLEPDVILYICIFLISIFSFAFIANHMINRGLKSSEKLIETSNQLEETLKVKDQLITLISHDLKNPIGNITMIVKELQRKTLSVTPEVLGMLNDTSSKASKLIESLTQWSVVKQDKTMIRKEDFKLCECVQETIDLSDIMSKQKQIKIINNCGTEIMVNADRRMISTVIRNLLSNAIKFSYDNSSIKLSSKTGPGFITLNIQDSGVGLSSTHQKKLFLENHEYVSIPGTSNEKGSGLGLIISKDFVVLNGGDIGVESELGKGSRFWFSIPMSQNNN